MTCNFSQCEVAAVVTLDELPFTSFTIVTTQATDLILEGENVTVTLGACSADSGCVEVPQRFRWDAAGVLRGE
jgi:hypothetical protein